MTITINPSFARVFLWILVLFLLAGLVQPKDTTDEPGFNPFARSGMTLHRDHLTGCEYLGRSGGLTPRLDANGKHLCFRGPQ